MVRPSSRTSASGLAADRPSSSVFRCGEHGQHGGPVAIAVTAPSSTEDALTILQQHREATNPTRCE